MPFVIGFIMMQTLFLHHIVSLSFLFLSSGFSTLSSIMLDIEVAQVQYALALGLGCYWVLIFGIWP